MAETAPLRVQLIAKTEFLAPPDVPWSTDADGGQALVEFAGRACYQSWSKPNPRTATNAAYLQHIIDVGHFSVLEHASVSLLHHRHLPLVHPRADPPPPLLATRSCPSATCPRTTPRWSSRPASRTTPSCSRSCSRPPTPAAPPTSSCWPGWRPSSPTSRTRCCGASRPGRPRARSCPTTPRPASSSPATTGPGGTSSRCGPASTPTSRSAGWRSPACVSSAPVAPAVFADFEIAELADGTEVATSRRSATDV